MDEPIGPDPEFMARLERGEHLDNFLPGIEGDEPPPQWVEAAKAAAERLDQLKAGQTRNTGMTEAMCKGSIALGSGCGRCSRCKAEIAAGVKPIAEKPRKMRPIPVSAAEKIAKDYGYDQVVVFARRVSNPLPPVTGRSASNEPGPEGEHLTTYGVNPTHCSVAATMGNVLKGFMRWSEMEDYARALDLLNDLESGTFDYSDYDETSERVAALRKILHAR